MNDVAKHKIISAYVRSSELAPDHDQACAAVAQALGRDVETVRGVVDEYLALSHEELA
ncbi:hypothetical protein [Variovorax boronicumulans]|uniref:hypothetical protein n=1 Tax=Variovorax boronicumulans TaxID=436515 RepID=UPI001C590B93